MEFKEISLKIWINILKFFKHPITNTKDWLGDTYEWISEALTNWDNEVYDLKDQAIYIFNKTISFFYMIAGLISKVITSIRDIINEILESLRGI